MSCMCNSYTDGLSQFYIHTLQSLPPSPSLSPTPHSTPVMGVIVNLTSLSMPAGTNNFHITITCGLNLTAVGLDNPPASLSRLHELPSDASTKITVRL